MQNRPWCQFPLAGAFVGALQWLLAPRPWCWGEGPAQRLKKFLATQARRWGLSPAGAAWRGPNPCKGTWGAAAFLPPRGRGAALSPAFAVPRGGEREESCVRSA